MIKAVFLDIDGTLRSFKTRTISEDSVEAIHLARKKGIKIFLCTSRAVQFLGNVLTVEYDGLVCLTGAHCLDKDHKTLSWKAIDSKDSEEIIRWHLDSKETLIAYGADNIYAEGRERNDFIDLLAVGGVPFNDFLPLEDCPPNKMLQFTITIPAGEEENNIMALMPHSHTERWHPDFTDIIGNDADKGVGLEAMAGHFGIKVEETMAIGDGANDIPMILKAGIGVAMGNAVDEVKKAADYVTLSVDEDGVSAAFRHFGLC